MYTPHPYGNGFYYAPTPPSPQDRERKNLRSSASAVGALLLAHIATMQLLYPTVIDILIAVGYLQKNAKNEPTLGLDNTTYLLLYGVVYALVMVLPLLIILFQKNKFNPLSPVRAVSGRVSFFGILGGIGVCMLANIVTSYICAILSRFDIPIPETPKMMDGSFASYLLNLLILAVLPGILEELIYRGCVIQMLRPYGVWFSVIVSAVTFGLMHRNIRQIPFAIIVGLALGVLYVITNNIWMPIIVHFLNNAISVTMEYLAYSLPKSSVSFFNAAIIFTLAALGTVFGILLVVFQHHQFKQQSTRAALTGGQRFGTLLRTPTFLIAIILFSVLTLLYWM